MKALLGSGLQTTHRDADIFHMSVPPPGWFNVPVDEDATARWEAHLESTRARRFMASALRGFRTVLVIVIVIAAWFAVTWSLSFVTQLFHGPE